MKPTPAGWPRISSSLYYDDSRAAIDWLCKAFGFSVRIKVEGEGGKIEHSELELADGLIMVSDAHKRPSCASPQSIGNANTQSVMVFVDDAEAHCKHARESGAKILMEPTVNDYGEDYWTDRTYEAEDLEGHRWWFCERLRGG
ncbi:MAG: VOC family protein [Minicystis sp.]